ncbi:MAG: hypothetical protein J6Q30_02465 [Oscillospiraceae bacterium]|nr:hypothetical protein [Oscillospiraceae bacterium]
MKKWMISIVIFSLVFIISIPLVNNYSARKVEKQLVEIALPDDTEMVESLSKAGKLVGNGNGMQYFGGVLIRSEKSLEELSAYYADKVTGAVVKEQKTQMITWIEHEDLSFETPVADTEGYYIVYLFGNGISPFSYLDIRGH